MNVEELGHSIAAGGALAYLGVWTWTSVKMARGRLLQDELWLAWLIHAIPTGVVTLGALVASDFIVGIIGAIVTAFMAYMAWRNRGGGGWRKKVAKALGDKARQIRQKMVDSLEKVPVPVPVGV